MTEEALIKDGYRRVAAKPYKVTAIGNKKGSRVVYLAPLLGDLVGQYVHEFRHDNGNVLLVPEENIESDNKS